jgi:hypothetical protein
MVKPLSVAKHTFASTLKSFKTASGKSGRFYSLPELAKQYPNIGRLSPCASFLSQFYATATASG